MAELRYPELERGNPTYCHSFSPPFDSLRYILKKPNRKHLGGERIFFFFTFCRSRPKSRIVVDGNVTSLLESGL